MINPATLPLREEYLWRFVWRDVESVFVAAFAAS